MTFLELAIYAELCGDNNIFEIDGDKMECKHFIIWGDGSYSLTDIIRLI